MNRFGDRKTHWNDDSAWLIAAVWLAVAVYLVAPGLS
jgi:hypothetical protein